MSSRGGLRFVLLGDGAWAARSLERLAGAGHEPAAVVLRARPTDTRLAATALALGVPVLQPADANAPELARALAELAPDVGLSVAYDRILRRPLLGALPHGWVNFHAGMLPRYRGRNVINWAIINGEDEIGLTAHLMDEGIDTGPILLQRSLPIAPTDGYGDVLARVVDALPDLVLETVARVADGTAEPRPQPAEGGTYFGGREPGDEWLDWTDTSRHLHDKIRGITRPGPGACTLVDGVPVRVWRARYDPAWPAYVANAGQVVGRADDGVLVKTGDSMLCLLEVELPDRPAGPPRWRMGTRLGVTLAAVVAELLARRPGELRHA
jgi:methionyl-tRNA formyltransferase